MLVHVKPFVMENRGYINANYELQAFYVTIFCEANHTSELNLHYGEKSSNHNQTKIVYSNLIF